MRKNYKSENFIIKIIKKFLYFIVIDKNNFIKIRLTDLQQQ